MRSPRRSRAGALALVVGGSLGCTPYSTQKLSPDGALYVPINCTVTDAYEFQTIDAFETPGSAPFWTSADCTAGASMAVTEVALPNGGQCGSKAALEISASHNDQWGSLTGYNNFGPRDGSAYQGISFWAVAPFGTTAAFTIALDDPNTSDDTGITPPIGNCTTYPTVDAGCGSPNTGTILDPSGMVLSSGTATPPPLPNQCGNSYSTTMLVTNQWQFYTVPFGNFHQAPNPNRVPNDVLTVTGTTPGTKLITSQLLLFTMRMPKAGNMGLLMDNLAFYRAKGSGPRDGGANGQ